MDNLEKAKIVLNELSEFIKKESKNKKDLSDYINGDFAKFLNVDFSFSGDVLQSQAELMLKAYGEKGSFDVEDFLRFSVRKIKDSIGDNSNIKNHKFNKLLRKVEKAIAKQIIEGENLAIEEIEHHLHHHHSHGESAPGYDPTVEGYEKLDMGEIEEELNEKENLSEEAKKRILDKLTNQRITEAYSMFGDAEHHLLEGLPDPSNSSLVRDAKTQLFLPTNFGYALEGEEKTSLLGAQPHSHNPKYIPHIPQNVIGVNYNNYKVTDDDGNDQKVSISTYSGSLFRMGGNGVNSALSFRAEQEKSTKGNQFELDDITLKIYKPIKQSEKGFMGAEARVSYSNNLHEEKPLFLPHQHSFAFLEGKSLETYLGLKSTKRFLTYAGGASLLKGENSELLGLGGELSFTLPKSLRGYGFFVTSALYTNASFPKYGIEGHQTTFGINYENHDNQKYLWHLKLTKKSNFNKINNEESENSTMAEFNLNAAIAPNLALGTNISREINAEHNETQAMLNLRFVPHKNFYTEVGIIKKIGEENEGGIIEKENQTNIFLSAGYLKNGVNLGIRSHFTKNEIGNLTPSLEVSARYNLNLASKIKG